MRFALPALFTALVCQSARGGLGLSVAAALAGAGVILQPAFLVQDALRDGRLVEFLPQYTQGETGIFVVYPTRKYLSAKVRALIDFLVEAFAAPQWRTPERRRRH